ncbi:MAG: hypothetical protein R3F56_13040 [Planctomycetota bacterium]
MTRFATISLASMALAVCGCDNVGRAYDRGGGGGGGATNPTNVAAPSVGSIFFDGRPKVRTVYPKGAGWTSTTPVVVFFNESVNQALTTPAQGDALVFCRTKGTTQRLPVAYNFLLGGSVLLMRPAPQWPPGQQGAVPEVEVLVSPQVRDLDGITIGNASEPTVVATFTPDIDTQAEPNGRIVTAIPDDLARDQLRETPLYLVFDRATTDDVVTTRNFKVSDGSGNELLGAVSAPIVDATVVDYRIARFDPSVRLPADSDVRITVDDTITFPDNGRLDFLGRTPFSRFHTLAFSGPDDVALSNPQPGFANKINRTNLANPMLDVSLPSNARAGDSVVVRIYGLDPETQPTDDIDYVEVKAAVPADNATLVTVPFPDKLGNVDAPRFSDGPATFAARVGRGSRSSGWAVAGAASEPSIDIGLPTLTTAGPPAQTGRPNDLVIDQEFATFYGLGSERISSATLSMRGSTQTSFGSAAGGRFMLRPIALGRSTVPVDYTLTLVDGSGNEGQPLTGTVTQRGFVTGVLAGDLTVEVFDEATLQVVPGARVLIEPGMPQSPPAGRQILDTAADGRALFSGLAGASYSVTVVATGYHLETLLTTSASFVSLGLRPQQKATASLQGAVLFTASAGTSARVGCNAFDDRLLNAVTPSAQLVLPATPIRPNRLLVLTGFAGPFDSAGNGAFTTSICSMCGSSGIQPTPGLAAVAPDGSVTQAVSIQNPAPGSTVTTQRYNRDFAASTGLGALQGAPTVRVAMSMLGISGTVLFGTGTPTMMGSATSFDVTAAYSLINAITLSPMSPVVWVSLEAADASGNLVRHRAIVTDISTGSTLGSWPTPGVPTITPPAGAFVGAPEVTYADRLDGGVIPGGIAVAELVATDTAGRRWTVRREDRNGAVGATTWQLPDLTGAGVAWLAPGTWKVRMAEHLAFSVTATPGDFFFEEIRRASVTLARTGEVDFVVN